MKPHVSMITLGVSDVARAKRFYAEGLGWPVHQQHGDWVAFSLGNGSSWFCLLPTAALAKDAGVGSSETGFRAVTMSHIVRSEERVDELLEEAREAGATIVKPATRAPWGGYDGCFADPDGHLWKVVAGAGDQRLFAE